MYVCRYVCVYIYIYDYIYIYIYMYLHTQYVSYNIGMHKYPRFLPWQRVSTSQTPIALVVRVSMFRGMGGAAH